MSSIYSRWTRYRNKSDIPQNVRCACLVAKTGSPCLTMPTYLIHATDTWACGRHLQKALPECSICLCEMSSKSEKRISCGHVFHDKCLSTWQDTTKEPRCPTCRSVYFASGWRPMSVPDDLDLMYYGWCSNSEHMRILIQSVFMELACYHYITKQTVRELVRELGSEWYTSVGDLISMCMYKDGSVDWSQMDYGHSSIQVLRLLETLLPWDRSFFVPN